LAWDRPEGWLKGFAAGDVIAVAVDAGATRAATPDAPPSRPGTTPARRCRRRLRPGALRGRAAGCAYGVAAAHECLSWRRLAEGSEGPPAGPRPHGHRAKDSIMAAWPDERARRASEVTRGRPSHSLNATIGRVVGGEILPQGRSGRAVGRGSSARCPRSSNWPRAMDAASGDSLLAATSRRRTLSTSTSIRWGACSSSARSRRSAGPC
jgi:hypothetical protein